MPACRSDDAGKTQFGFILKSSSSLRKSPHLVSTFDKNCGIRFLCQEDIICFYYKLHCMYRSGSQIGTMFREYGHSSTLAMHGNENENGWSQKEK